MVLNPSQVLTDVQKQHPGLGQLGDADRRGVGPSRSATDGSGPSWVAAIVNAIGASAYWPNTVILITWDDWGGWYDHVPPPLDPNYGYYQNGFRVPLLVVSAYTPSGYVSQTTHTFGSILKFVETAFGLGLIPPGTFADATADDLSDFFDFNQPPRPFQAAPAKIDADFFKQTHRETGPPDTD